MIYKSLSGQNSDPQAKNQTRSIASMIWGMFYTILRPFLIILRYIKYLLLFIVMVLWVVACISIGVLLIKFHTSFSKQKASYFIVAGVVPILILILYLLLRYQTHKTVDWGLLKCR